MPNSRRKGAQGERELAEALGRALGRDMQRGARNGVKGADDVIGWPGVHVEVKRYKGIAAARFMDQSVGDAAEGQVPIVAMRENRGEWIVMVRLTDLTDLCDRV